MRTGYAPVNGLQLYYEIHGEGGMPLVMLHGGVVGIPMFGPNVAALASDRQVIAVELQGHGRTKDIDRPLSYEAMADDVAALVSHLGFAQVDLMGISLGGGVAQQLAFRHPELVRHLIVVSVPFKRTGWYPEVLDQFDHMGPANGEMMKGSPLAQTFPDVDWPKLFGKIGELQRKDYDWSAQVAALAPRTMLIFADADAVHPTHIVDFFRLLGGGLQDAGLDGSNRPRSTLAILPGLTHYTIASAPALADAMRAFLQTA